MVSTDVVTEILSPEAEATSSDGSSDISNWKLTIYALPAIPIAFLYLPVSMLMPAFYSSAMHVSLTTVGIFLVFSRVADVFLDPAIGKWSDMTNSTYGRRKLWMWFGTPVLMLGSFLLFMPIVQAGGWYLLIASFVIYAGGSMVGLPYAAWGTELMASYNGRSRMAGFREAAGVIGGLAAAMVPAITGHFGHGVDRFTMGIMGCVIIVLTPLTVWITTRNVDEPPVAQRARVAWIPSIIALLKNGPFRLFCIAYIVFTIGGSVAAATMVFYLNDYLGQPTLLGPGILLLALTSVAAVPFWLWMSRLWSKHVATAVSLLLSMVLYGGVTPLLHHGQGWIYVIYLGVIGAISSGFLTLPFGLLGDIIDYDTLKHREKRGGLYFGVWSFAQKISPALGIGITLPLLNALGYRPGVHNTAAALEALKYVYAFGPVPFYVAGGILLLFFPINAKRHDVIRRRLLARERRGSSTPGALPAKADRNGGH
jgi:GPH family glycoside/pentoside/hexuronide:cation symporter